MTVTRRGSSLVGVLATLAILAMVFAVMAQALTTDLASTRRRANVQYANELARSGIDWARGCLAARCGLADTTLSVVNGSIAIHVDVGDGGTKIRSRGTVLANGSAVEVREEVLEIGTRTRDVDEPPLAGAGPAPTPPVEAPPVLSPRDFLR